MEKTKCCTRNVTICFLLVIGIVFLIGGCVLIPEFPKLLRSQINENIVIKKGSQGYDEFHSPTSPMYMSFYVFDLQNEQEVMKGGKPNVTQRGPYTYKEFRVNIPVLWEDNGNKLTYLENKTYIFDAEKSGPNCSDSDVVTTPNLVPLTLINKTKDANIGLHLLFATVFTLAKVQLFHKLPVKEVLFGYNDTLLLKIVELEKSPLGKPFFDQLKKFDPALYNELKDLNPFVQLQYNGTAALKQTGNTTILTGKDDINSLQTITKWKGKSTLPFWNSTYGNMINGTDGTHFPPNPSKTDRLYIFVSDVCRSMYLNYKKDSYLKDIKLQMYSTLPEIFQNASVNPENAAFCVPKCYGTGLLHIGQCLPMNPPVMMSGPHFYQGDPKLVNAIIGMHPDPQKHGTFLYVEPYTGITMKAFKRLQVNIDIVAVSSYAAFMGSTKSVIFPIMYIEEHGEVSDADAKKFKNQVYFAVSLGEYLQYGLIALGAVLILTAITIGFVGRRKDGSTIIMSSEKTPLLT